MLTWLGRVTANAMHSATSSAVSGVMPSVDGLGGALIAAEPHDAELGLDEPRTTSVTRIGPPSSSMRSTLVIARTANFAAL